MKFSESVESLLPALIEVQGSMTTPKKSRTGQTGNQKYKYADLSDIMEIVQPLFFKHSLFISHPFEVGDNWIKVSTLLRHKSGEWVESGSLVLKGNVSNEKEQGKLLTYGKRYSLCALMGIAADEDTDGRQTEEQPNKNERYTTSDKKQRSTSTTQSQKPKTASQNKPPQAVDSSKPETMEKDNNRKRFFALCGERKLSEKVQKMIVEFYTEKLSRADVTEEEYKQINEEMPSMSKEKLLEMAETLMERKQPKKEKKPTEDHDKTALPTEVKSETTDKKAS
jgi:hypothetical protein